MCIRDSAPTSDRSVTDDNSVPCPAVPEANMIGFSRLTLPIEVRSGFLSLDLVLPLSRIVCFSICRDLNVKVLERPYP